MARLMGTSRRLAALLPVNVAEFGARFGGADDTQAVQTAINTARSRGNMYVQIDRDVTCTGALANRSNVVFVGEGSLTGEGAYRRQVTEAGAPSLPPRFGDLVPHRHMRRFSGAASPRVVLVGSSTGSWQPNTVDGVSSLPNLLHNRLLEANPEKKIAFFNRAIGGQTFGTLNGVPSSFPAWYADQAKPWLDYVKDLAPDVVFIVMGSNDANSLTLATLKSVVDKIKAFPKLPDIVFVTQPSVALDPHEALASYGTKAGQEGRDYAAGLVRTFAKFEGYGLVDGNRMGGIVLDGRDLLDTASRRVLTNVTLPTGGFISTIPCHDFSMRVRFTGDAAAIVAAFSNAENPVHLRLGAGGDPGAGGDIVFIKRNAAGKFEFVFWADGTAYKGITTEFDFPTQTFALDLAKIGTNLIVSIPGQEDAVRMVFPIKAHGGEFLPRIAQHASMGGGPFDKLEFLNVGEPRRYIPTLTGVQAFGEPNAGANTQLPYGGNGVNHFSSVGTRAIYSSLLDLTSLAASQHDSGKYTPKLTPFSAAWGTLTPSECTWYRTGNIVTVVGMATVQSTTANVSLSLDISLPVDSNIASSLDVAGLAISTGTGGTTGSFHANGATREARMRIWVASTNAENVRFNFTYEIKP